MHKHAFTAALIGLPLLSLTLLGYFVWLTHGIFHRIISVMTGSVGP